MGLKKLNTGKITTSSKVRKTTKRRVVTVHHKARVLSYADVQANRSKAYTFLSL